MINCRLTQNQKHICSHWCKRWIKFQDSPSTGRKMGNKPTDYRAHSTDLPLNFEIKKIKFVLERKQKNNRFKVKRNQVLNHQWSIEKSTNIMETKNIKKNPILRPIIQPCGSHPFFHEVDIHHQPPSSTQNGFGAHAHRSEPFIIFT